jgi:hypothetical protein
MNSRKTSFAVLAVTLLVTAACLDNSITGTRTLTIALTASATSVEIAETVTASVSATGTGLQGILIEWGDGVVDSLPLTGTAVSAQSNFDHEYQVVGSYTVVATAEDQSGGISDSTSVTVTAAPRN